MLKNENVFFCVNDTGIPRSFVPLTFQRLSATRDQAFPYLVQPVQMLGLHQHRTQTGNRSAGCAISRCRDRLKPRQRQLYKSEVQFPRGGANKYSTRQFRRLLRGASPHLPADNVQLRRRSQLETCFLLQPASQFQGGSPSLAQPVSKFSAGNHG